MAPIIRLAAGPLSIITGTLFGTLSAPSSSPPPSGVGATIWGTDYSGTASFLDLISESVPFPVAPTTPNASNKKSKKKAPAPLPLPPSSSLVYYNSTADNFTGCNNKVFTWDDTVVFMNPLQFGDIKAENSTCGEWIEIKNRENTARTALAQIVGVCNDCEYGSFSMTLGGLEGLAPDLPFEEMVFDRESTLSIDDLLHGEIELPISTPVSPKDLLNVEWSLTDAPKKEEPEPIKPTTTTTIAATTTTKTSASPTPTKKPDNPDKPDDGGKMFTGRATWFSDNSGQCEHKFSQDDLIVAVNEAQMGKDKKICGKKILLTKKGSDVKVVVTVVDMCPSKYCKFGQLDISRAAFKKFASLDKGIMDLTWKFLD
ncbi:hypothetical protein BGX34_008731 [Mortierella sp. NVP85]|nr:hypothetical protein BGX34_008731 [Mortierella sp. NVP85]